MKDERSGTAKIWYDFKFEGHDRQDYPNEDFNTLPIKPNTNIRFMIEDITKKPLTVNITAPLDNKYIV